MSERSKQQSEAAMHRRPKRRGGAVDADDPAGPTPGLINPADETLMPSPPAGSQPVGRQTGEGARAHRASARPGSSLPAEPEEKLHDSEHGNRKTTGPPRPPSKSNRTVRRRKTRGGTGAS